MDVTVVIRAAGERTLPLCRELAERQVLPGSVCVVQAAPFEEALRQSFQAGMEACAKWTATIDADVLPRPGVIAQMVTLADHMSRRVFQICGRVYDKLLLCARDGGLRLYRTATLDEIVSLIPERGTAVRPEFVATKRMMEHGWRCDLVDLVTGIHDFEQFYRDIYRKALLHAHKFTDEVGGVLSAWRTLSMRDADYRVAIKGYCAGLQSDVCPQLDIRAFEGLDCGLHEFSLAEKAPLRASEDDAREYERFVESIILKECPSRRQRFFETSRRKGLGCATFAAFGALSMNAGRRLRDIGTWFDKERAR